MLSHLTIVVALALMCVAPLSWRNCVKLLLYLVVFEGAIRKWLLPGSQEAVFFAKDVVAVVAYVKFLNDTKVPRRLPPYNLIFKVLLGASAFYALCEACNPNTGSPLVGAIGAKNYILYIPLTFLVGHLFDSQRALYRFLRNFSLLALPMFVLSVFQYNAPETSWLNVYASELQIRASVADRPRITGTFSYISGFASFLVFLSAIVVPFLYLKQSWWYWLLCRVNIVLITACMLMTGSRSTLVFLLCFSFGYLALNPALLLPRNVIRAAPSVIGMLLVMSTFFYEELENYIFRVETSSDKVHERVVLAVLEPFYFMPEAGLIGFGAGATYQGADRIRQVFDLQAGTPIAASYEGEPGRVMLEFGPLGFCLWFGMRVFCVLLLWRLFYSLRLPLTRQLAITATLFHTISLVSPLVFSAGSSVFYWFLAGFIFLLPRIEAAEIAQSNAQQQG